MAGADVPPGFEVRRRRCQASEVLNGIDGELAQYGPRRLRIEAAVTAEAGEEGIEVLEPADVTALLG